MSAKKSVSEMIERHYFDRMGGVKMQVVYPTDERIKDIKYKSVPGNIESHLANFGKYQFGSSITTSVYRPGIHKNACQRMVEDEQQYAQTNGLSYGGFVIVESGACSLETKARNIQDLGGQVALIVTRDSAGVFEEVEDD